MSTKRHTAYNLGGAIVPVLLMLVTVPFYLKALGEARYGILAIVWLFAGYFAFFDFGLGRATARAIAKASDATDEFRAKTFWTALIINAAFGVIGGLVVLLVARPLFEHVFNIPQELLDEILPVLPWLALAIPLLTFEGVFTGALTGREKFLSLNIRQIVGAVLTQGIPLAAVLLISPTLDLAIPATIVARFLSVSLHAYVAFRAIPASLRPMFGGKAMAKELLGYGGWVSLASFINPLIANLDRFLIATFLTPAAVAHYTVPLQLVTRGAVFSNALCNALFPRFSKLSADEARSLAMRAIRANAGLMVVLCVAGILVMRPFLALWIDAEFAAKAALVGQLLAISLWLNAVSVVPYNLLQAQGRPKETTVVLVVQILPFLAVAVPGTIYLAIMGTALARNLRSIVEVSLLTARTGLLRSMAGIALAPLSLMALAIFSSSQFESTSLEGLLAGAALICASIVWALAISRDLRHLLFARLNAFGANRGT